MIFTFNLFDTFGRYLPNWLTCNKFSLTIIIFSRCIFIFSFPITILIQRTTENFITLSFFILIQIALLALSNGYSTSLLSSLVIREVPKHLIGRSGSTIALFKILGIALGSIYAIVVTKNLLI